MSTWILQVALVVGLIAEAAAIAVSLSRMAAITRERLAHKEALDLVERRARALLEILEQLRARGVLFPETDSASAESPSELP